MRNNILSLRLAILFQGHARTLSALGFYHRVQALVSRYEAAANYLGERAERDNPQLALAAYAPEPDSDEIPW